MHTISICNNPLCGVLTVETGDEPCACGGAFHPMPDAPDEHADAEVDDATHHGIEAYRLSWLKRLDPYWPVAAFIGPTGAGKSSLLNLALGWPVLWGRSGSHTTRCPAILTDHDTRVVSCGNEKVGLEYLCEPNGAMRTEVSSLRNIMERLEFISERKIGGGLRDKFWRSFEDQFADWHQSGITGDVYVKVQTPLPGIPKSAAIIDVPGFDGSPNASDSDRFRLENELAAATDFWSEAADVAVFVLELESLNRGGEAERLAKRIRQDKPTAVFFNKLDRLDLWQHGLEDDSPNSVKAAWKRYKEDRLRKLQEAGVDDCAVFFGFSAFDARGKPPAGPLAREWSTETARLLDWTRQALRKTKKQHKKRPPEHPVARWRDETIRAILTGESPERKELVRRARECVAEWMACFPEDLPAGGVAGMSLTECHGILVRAADSLYDAARRSVKIFEDEVMEEPVRRAFFEISMLGRKFASLSGFTPNTKSSEYKNAGATYETLVNDIGVTEGFFDRLVKAVGLGGNPSDARRQQLARLEAELFAYVLREFSDKIPWYNIPYYEITWRDTPDMESLLDIGPLDMEDFLKHREECRAFSVDKAFHTLVEMRARRVADRLSAYLDKAREDFEIATRHKTQADAAKKLREKTRALLDEAEKLTGEEAVKRIVSLKNTAL